MSLQNLETRKIFHVKSCLWNAIDIEHKSKTKQQKTTLQ